MCPTLHNSVLPLLRHPPFLPARTAGRAAQRLQEVLFGEAAEDVSASTIHRLLGYRNGAFQKRMAKLLEEVRLANARASIATIRS